jgi:hypothetical protein
MAFPLAGLLSCGCAVFVGLVEVLTAIAFLLPVQHERMGLAIGGVVTVANDLSRVVDSGRVGQLKAGAGPDQLVEILEFPAAVDEGMVERRPRGVHAVSLADYHPGIVDRLSYGINVVGSEVGHLPAAVQKRVRRVRLGLGPTNDLADVIDSVGAALRASQRPEIRDPSVGIQEGVEKPVREIRTTHHLMRIVDAAGGGVIASERAQVRHFPAAVNEGTLTRAVYAGRPAHNFSEVVDAVRFAAAVGHKRSQVGHLPVVNKKGVVGSVRQRGIASHISCTVDSCTPAEDTAQRAEVRHGARAVNESVFGENPARMTRRAASARD